jgi:hypothetical protein
VCHRLAHRADGLLERHDGAPRPAAQSRPRPGARDPELVPDRPRLVPATPGRRGGASGARLPCDEPRRALADRLPALRAAEAAIGARRPGDAPRHHRGLRDGPHLPERRQRGCRALQPGPGLAAAEGDEAPAGGAARHRLQRLGAAEPRGHLRRGVADGLRDRAQGRLRPGRWDRADFVAPDAGDWTVAMAACALDASGRWNEFCGTWYARVDTR